MSEVPDIRKNYIDVLNSVNKITEAGGIYKRGDGGRGRRFW